MRTRNALCLTLLLVLPACSLLDAALEDKPNNDQLHAIGDMFVQMATVADVMDDPAAASNADLVDAMRLDHFATFVAPPSSKPRVAAALRAAPAPGCVTASGNDRIFDCDVTLDDGRMCLVRGTLTRSPVAGGNEYRGTLTLAPGATGCPTASMTLNVFLGGPANDPTSAAGSIGFQLDDPSGDRFSGAATLDGVGLTSACTLPSEGELTVTLDGTAGGAMITNRSVTVSFHHDPGCVVYIE